MEFPGDNPHPRLAANTPARRADAPVRGTVLLVSLCLVAVLGVMLWSYIAVCTRAMTLSNRSFQTDLSRQLAEMGIDEALRAFNKNDYNTWSSGGMTVTWDKTTYSASKRAVASISFPSNKFAQGTTATVKIRVDNHDAKVLGSPWSSAKSYKIGDIVGYSGNWYSCVSPHTNQTPTAIGNLGYWVPAPIPWQWSGNISYTMYDLVNHEGTWYRWVGTSNSNVTPSPTSTSWTTIPANVTTWSSATSYVLDQVVTYNSVNYRCIQAHSNRAPPNATYWSTTVNSVSLSWASGTKYTVGSVVFNDGVWYYCITTHQSGGTFAGDSSNWSSAPLWQASTQYQIGELVYRANTWYTCKVANSNASFTAANWVSPGWVAGTAYTVGNIVNADGNWWRCVANHTASSAFATDYNASRWASAVWASSTTYAVNQVVLYQGGWWNCITGHTSGTSFNASNFSRRSYPLNGLQFLPKSYQFNDVAYYSTSGNGTWYRRDTNSTTAAVPTNTTYWENALNDSWDWDSTDNYNLGDVVCLSGSFYRCIRGHSNQTPPNSNYWSTEPPFSTYWDAAKTYSANDVVRYRGAWYRNLSGTNTRPGTNTADWSIAALNVEPWSSTKSYHVDDLVSASGNWYRCIKDHTNQAVNLATHWTQIAGPSHVWNASTAYATNSYVSYGGAWYKCIAPTTANAGHTPNNTTYWTPTWSQSSGVTTGAPVVYAEAAITIGDGTTSKTQLRAAVDLGSLFPNAAAGNTTLTITGSAAGTVDSYDSSLAGYVAADAGYAAVLAAGTESTSGTSTLLSIGNSTTVKGYASAPSSTTSPYAPRSSYGSSATVKGFSSAASPNVDPAQVSRSPYIPNFRINPAIAQTDLPTLPTTLNLGTPGSPTPSVYYDTSPSIGTTVNINGPVIWYVNGNLRVNASESMYINSTGSLTLYITGSTTGRLRVESTSGGITNRTLDPKKCIILGDTAYSSTQYYSYVGSFYGAIYMPDITATAGLTIAAGAEVYGAISAYEVTFSGAGKLHYDTSLRYHAFTGVDQPHIITNWSELPVTEAATMP